ncbi:MAG: hypothetical protein MJY76_07855 [Bacteroidales bacterium]|nr:hypothetical protein [Bacteroidales bacterium]
MGLGNSGSANGVLEKPAAVPQCLYIIDLLVRRSIPYRIEAVPVRNVCFCSFGTGFALFLYETSVLACDEQV